MANLTYRQKKKKVQRKKELMEEMKDYLLRAGRILIECEKRHELRLKELNHGSEE